MRRLSVLCLGVLGAAVSPSCKASVNANVNVGSGDKQVADFDQPLDTTQSTREADPDEGVAAFALLGARHDLRLSAGGNATCGCLAVTLGQPGDAVFAWQSVVPKTNPDTQLVLAMSADGIACPAAPKDSMGASYWGWRRNGDDIIVLVENARFGRPLTNGAIIPKPMGDGQVWIRPAGKDVPYGRPLDATHKDCKIGNPGSPRSTSLGPNEDPRDDVPTSRDDRDIYQPADAAE